MSGIFPRSRANSRTCGSCQACCLHLEIESRPGYSTRSDTGEDLAKKSGTPCKYLTSRGCGIYETRPAVCRAFRCDWLVGRSGASFARRPDEGGAIGVRGVRLVFDPLADGQVS